MLKKILRLLDGETLRIFIRLWFQDKSLADLQQEIQLPDDRLQDLLRDLEDRDILEENVQEAQSIWLVDPEFRAKLSKTLLRLTVAGALSVLGSIVAFSDQALFDRRQSRLNKQLRQARK